jgi:hypothetical protein
MGAPNGIVHFANCGQLAARRVACRAKALATGGPPAKVAPVNKFAHAWLWTKSGLLH